MLAAKDPDTGRSMSEAEVKDNVLTFIFGGQETTSSALTWTIYLVTQSTHWRERVLTEAQQTEGLPAEDALPKLILTRAVVEEALRLYPPIIGITRTALRQTKIADHPIEKGTLVIISPYVVHRHRLLWNEPEVFDPTRFLSGNAGSIRPYTYMPFGAGPRTCIGAGLQHRRRRLRSPESFRTLNSTWFPGKLSGPLRKTSLCGQETDCGSESIEEISAEVIEANTGSRSSSV